MKLPKIGMEKMNGKVIGEFVCDSIEEVDISYPAYQDRLGERFTKDSCVPYFQLHRYASKNRLHDNLFSGTFQNLNFTISL